MYNLTYGQKKLAEWLVNNVKNGSLIEEFTIYWDVGGHYSVGLSSYKGQEEDLQNITQNTIKILAENKLIAYKSRSPRHCINPQTGSIQLGWDCALTSDMYSAVENNFGDTGTSFINYLTPLANPSDFDKEIVRRCFPVLTIGGSNPDWDTAVRNSGVVLEERLSDVGSINDPNRTGRDLVNDVFGDKGTLTSKFSIPSERIGYRELYSGIVGAFRNPSAHRFIDPSPEEGGAFIVFVNLLLKKLEDLR
jgi:hypothetical protein